MKYLIGKIVFFFIGWRVEASEEIKDRARNTVTIAAPHTSNFDTLLALGTFWQMRLPMKFLIKDFYTKWYFFGFFTWLGAIGVNRAQRSNLVATSAQLMKERDINLIISPEGTRSYTEKWKSGFLRITAAADCQIVLAGFDFPSRCIVIGEQFTPSGDNDSDIAAIKGRFLPYAGKKPDQF